MCSTLFLRENLTQCEQVKSSEASEENFYPSVAKSLVWNLDKNSEQRVRKRHTLAHNNFASQTRSVCSVMNKSSYSSHSLLCCT